MSAVRFGRVPKREKAKILAAMQKVNMNSMEKQLNEQLDDESKLLSSLLEAHDETCDFTKVKVAPLIQRARSQPVFASCPSQMACPLNPMPQHMENAAGNRVLEDFSERFSPAIKGVVEFAKRIPGFSLLSLDDQVTLLKVSFHRKVYCGVRRHLCLSLSIKVVLRQSHSFAQSWQHSHRF